MALMGDRGCVVRRIIEMGRGGVNSQTDGADSEHRCQTYLAFSDNLKPKLLTKIETNISTEITHEIHDYRKSPTADGHRHYACDGPYMG